jgi:hypothetical protein
VKAVRKQSGCEEQELGNKRHSVVNDREIIPKLRKKSLWNVGKARVGLH